MRDLARHEPTSARSKHYAALRFAVRTLRRTPGFTAIAALALTLAIGANTAIFGVINAVILRPLPVDRPDGLISLAVVYRPRHRIDASIVAERLIANLSVGFGLLALFLATVGLYGVLAYLTARRTSEIGIRTALRHE